MLNQKVVSGFGDTLLNTVCSLRGVAIVWAMSSVLVACGGSSTKSTSSTTGSSQAVASQVQTSSNVSTNSSAPSLRFVTSATSQSIVEGDDFGVEVVAEDDDGIQNVSLYIDGQLVRFESIYPYSWGISNEFAWARDADGSVFRSSLVAGTHQLRAVAEDKQGLRSEATVTINVSAAPIVANVSQDSIGSVVTAPASEFASRTFGVAPLSVHFDSGYEGEDFQDYHFTWDFGESSADVNVHNGLSKNSDTGPIAGHLYETPGTYTAVLTVRDKSGAQLSTNSVTIAVTDPDVVYAGTATKCLSRSGDFVGCPTGAQQLTASDAQIGGQLGASNSRILLRRGDSWDTVGSAVGIVSNLYIGAYGACVSPDTRGICDNAPVLNNVGAGWSSTISLGRPTATSQTENIIIEDIYFTGEGNDSTRSISLNNLNSLTINRVKGTVITPLIGDGMHNSGIYNSDLSGGLVTVYTDGRNMVMKNNTFHDSDTSHVVRFTIANKLVFTHNEVHSASATGVGSGTGFGHLLKLHSLHEGDVCSANRTDWCNRFIQGSSGSPPEARYSTQYVYIANNLFGKGGNWQVALMAQNSVYNEVLKDVIFEKNQFDATYGNPMSGGSMSVNIMVQGENITIRNNLFDTEGLANSANPININNRNSQAPSDGVQVYNNTINTDVNSFPNGFSGIRVHSNQKNVTIKNNLVVRPNSQNNAVLVRDEGVGTVQSNNLYVNDADFVDVSGAPRNSNYLLNASSPALNVGDGSVTVLDDFDGVFRSSAGSGNIDVGAYEQ